MDDADKQRALHVDHYVDDFITVGCPETDECSNNTTIMHHVYEESGTVVEEDKTEGAATTLPALGIEIDMIAMELRLLPEKLHMLLQKLSQWRRKDCLHQAGSEVNHRQLVSCMQGHKAGEKFSEVFD